MARHQIDGPCRIERLPPSGVVVATATAADPAPCLVLVAGVEPAPPTRVHDPRVEPTGPGRWRLSCREGEFELRAAGLEWLDPRPQLFQELLAGHALRTRDRVVARGLLLLLGLPGGARLLRAWHARRG